MNKITGKEITELALKAKSNQFGHREALASLIEACGRLIHACAARVVRPGLLREDLREDAVQVVSIAFCRAVETFDASKSGFVAWAYLNSKGPLTRLITDSAQIRTLHGPDRIKAFKEIKALLEAGEELPPRLAAIQAAANPCSDADGETMHLRDQSETPDAAAEKCELCQAVREAMKSLPPAQMEAVDAFLTGKPEKRASKQARNRALHRAFEAMRPHLEEFSRKTLPSCTSQHK